jgi:hypothetical protein
MPVSIRRRVSPVSVKREGKRDIAETGTLAPFVMAVLGKAKPAHDVLGGVGAWHQWERRLPHRRGKMI